MIIKKILKPQGSFAKTGEDIKDGDVVTILDEGMTIPGEYGDQDVFKIKTEDGKEFLKAFNQSSKNNFIDAFGENTIDWIGKKAQVFVIKMMVSGKMKNVAFMAPEGWVMMDDGTFASRDENKDSDEIQDEDIPI